MCLIPPASNYDSTCEIFSTKETHQRLSTPRIFCFGGWSRRHILCSMYQISILPEEKQKFSIYDVCANNLATVTHPSVMERRKPSLNPSFQTPAKGQSYKQGFLRIAVIRPAMTTLFCTTGLVAHSQRKGAELVILNKFL